MSRTVSDNIIPMENRTIVLSAVIVLMDGFYDGERIVTGYTEMTFKEGVNPLKKTDALYAAVNLTPRTYEATIRAQYYFTKVTTFEIPAYDPATTPKTLLRIPVTLEPNPAYPYPENTTLLRGRVLDADTGLPIGDRLSLVMFMKSGKELKRTGINSFGQFVFSFADTAERQGGSVMASVCGYELKSVDVPDKPADLAQFTIRLTKQPLGNLGQDKPATESVLLSPLEEE